MKWLPSPRSPPRHPTRISRTPYPYRPGALPFKKENLRSDPRRPDPPR